MESTAALNSKVAALEDEMRIVKGEVKQVLTEIRSAILAQDSPFIEGGQSGRNSSRPVQIVPAVHDEPARVEIVMPKPEAVEPAPAPAAPPSSTAAALAPRARRPDAARP